MYIHAKWKWLNDVFFIFLVSEMDYKMILQKTPSQWFSKLILDHKIHPEQ